MRVSWYRYHEWNIYGYSIFMIYIHRYISFSWYIIEKPSLDIYIYISMIYSYKYHPGMISLWHMAIPVEDLRVWGDGPLAEFPCMETWSNLRLQTDWNKKTSKHIQKIYTEIVDIYSGKMLTFSIYLFGGWYTLSSSGEIFWTYSAGIAAGKSSEWSCKAQPDHISSVSFQSPVDW